MKERQSRLNMNDSNYSIHDILYPSCGNRAAIAQVSNRYLIFDRMKRSILDARSLPRDIRTSIARLFIQSRNIELTIT